MFGSRKKRKDYNKAKTFDFLNRNDIEFIKGEMNDISAVLRGDKKYERECFFHHHGDKRVITNSGGFCIMDNEGCCYDILIDNQIRGIIS